MDKDKFAPGEPCWADTATDLAKAVPFYTALLGWEVEDLGPTAGNYHLASLRGRLVAGLGGQMNPGPPTWQTYFRTDDAARTLAKVREHGGTVVTDVMEVMESGHMAFAADPSGAVFGLWQPRAMPGFGVVDESGAYAWAELTTTRVEGCTAFYGEVFGWGSETGEDEAMDYTEFQLGVTSIAGVMAMPEAMPAGHPSSWGVYFQVDDTDETVAAATGLGGAAVFGPVDIAAGRIAQLADPAGATFSVIAIGQA
jgi:predicted enzyme related to lactoylglutathione lyase